MEKKENERKKNLNKKENKSDNEGLNIFDVWKDIRQEMNEKKNIGNIKKLNSLNLAEKLSEIEIFIIKLNIICIILPTFAAFLPKPYNK